MAQGTARTAANYDDNAAARSVVMAALGQADESEVEASETGDTDATEATADDVEDSDESADQTEETADEGTESDDEDEEPVEAKAKEEEDSPFSAEDKAALAKAPPEVQKLAKGLQRSYTKKMQALGETEKFRKLFEGDPQLVIQRLAETSGLKVKIGEEAAVTTASPATPATPAVSPVQAVAASVRAKWVPIVGEEAADQLLAGMQEIVNASTGAAVAPIIEGQTKQAREQAQAKFKEDFGRFEKEHPDWREHETAMLELSKQLNPQMSPYETAKFLYNHVTRDKQVAKARTEGALKTATKVKRAVEAAEPAPRTRIPGSKVKTAPPVYQTSRDAILAAMGEQGYVES